MYVHMIFLRPTFMYNFQILASFRAKKPCLRISKTSKSSNSPTPNEADAADLES